MRNDTQIQTHSYCMIEFKSRNRGCSYSRKVVLYFNPSLRVGDK